MDDAPRDGQSEIDLSAVDAAYRPIGTVADWRHVVIANDIWDRYSENLRAAREIASDQAVRDAARRILRAAAAESPAVEGFYQTDRGFTLSVASQAAGWEVAFEARGSDARALFEAQMEGFELALDAATQPHVLTEAWLRRVHEVVTRPQETYQVRTSQGIQEQPLPKGQYKRHPNHVYLGQDQFHAYAPVLEVGPEMGRLVTELSRPEFQSLHPVIQAAYAHHSVTAIHPFADGNGRVARTVASVFLLRAESIPFLLHADQAAEYFAALSRADSADVTPFIHFVFDRAIDTIGEMSVQLRAASVDFREPLGPALEPLYQGYGGLSHKELDSIRDRLEGTILEESKAQLKTHVSPNMVGLAERRSGKNVYAQPGYRTRVGTSTTLRLSLQTKPPAAAHVEAYIEVLVAQEKHLPFAFVVGCSGVDGATLEIRLRDAHPELSASLKHRIDSWIRWIIGRLGRDLHEKAEAALRSAGY